jgi:23S rRNA U2552 (ribose-2'-O)-methylase RlmE/FtsJ/DNA-directed RNA polymerase subunit E'/Rpb7
MVQTYISTNYQTKVDLFPREMERGKIETHLTDRLRERYEGKTIKDGNVMGYIRKGSLKLVERSRGFYSGSHFTGHVTYSVVVNFDLYTPIINSMVEATVEKSTQVGFIAKAGPLSIIVAKSPSFQQADTLFDKIEPGREVLIELLTYELRGKYIYAVGRIVPFEGGYAKSFELDFEKIAIGELGTLKAQEKPIAQEKLPAPRTETYGDTALLNEKKDALADKKDPLKVQYWETYMRPFMNDFEIIGNNNYFPNDSIFTLDPRPFSRAYYKLVEIIADSELLLDFEDEAINVLLLGEAPGGFIHAMVDARKNNPYHEQDRYTAITAPVNPELGVDKDWNTNLRKDAVQYLAGMKNKDLLTIDLTDATKIKDFLESTEDDDTKMQIITADGGTDVESSDNYNYQEMIHYKLFYGEILMALGSQAKKGHYVMKIYDIYTDVTNQLVQLLANFYEKITIIKPNTSRPANSERYLVCKYFRGLHDFPMDEHLALLKAWNAEEKDISVTMPYTSRKYYVTKLFDSIIIDPAVTTRIKEKNELFVKRQIEALDDGLRTLETLRNPATKEEDKIAIVRDKVNRQINNALEWCKKYLPDNCKKTAPAIDIKYYRTEKKEIPIPALF